MSIKHSSLLSGHSAKRRKLSHESSVDEEVLEFSDRASSEQGDESDEAKDISQTGGGQTRNDLVNHSASSRTKPSSRKNDTLAKTVATTASSSNPATTLMFQASRLISDIRPDYDTRLRKVRPMSDKIVAVIKSTPERKAMTLAETQSFAQKTLRTTIPWNLRPNSDVKYSFRFKAPSKIQLSGSLTHRLGTKENLTVVIMPEMPSDLFQEKDYLNYRALHKRAFYLACLALNLDRELRTNFNMQYTYLDDNELLPVIELTLADHSSSSSQTYHVCPVFHNTLGPVSKMLPSSCCVRKDDLVQNTKTDTIEATPFYNSSFRWLASTADLDSLVERAGRKADHFSDACFLGAVWLHQRGFTSSRSKGGFGLEEWSIICALLLESGGHQGHALFSPRYSAIQLFRAMLQVLASRDMHEPFVVRGTMKLDPSDTVTLFDAATGVNVLYKMTAWSYERLKHHAAASMSLLNSKKAKPFDPTFINKLSDPSLQYDETYEIELASLPHRSLSTLTKIYNVLRIGLGERVSLVDVQQDLGTDWKTTSSAPAPSISKIVLGLLVVPETANRLVDNGPSVEQKQEAERFRKFWGEKAELRRFKDGRITETLVWSADMSVTHQIIQYLCARHFKLPPSTIRVSGALPSLQLPNMLSAEEVFTTINAKFQSLSSTLHHLDGLPLPVRSVAAASEALHSSSLTLPLEPGKAHPINTIIQFDSSGRWPDNLRAIQYTKIAFLTKVGDLLRGQDKSLETRIGLENTTSSRLGTENTSFLDILFPAPSATIPPIIFRLRIYHDRELHLIQQALSPQTALPPPIKDAHQLALHGQKQIPASISHTNAIRTLITTFPPLSSTIRLLKRFVASHHLSNHVPPEVCELLAAHVFLNPAPWTTPGTATTAFTRCLHFLARWEWASSPLIVDLSPSQDMSLSSRQELESRFAAWRKLDPNMNSVAYFIGTNVDSTGVVWTQGAAGADARPPRVIAGRLTALAGAAMDVIKAKSAAESPVLTKVDWQEIFASSLDDFDFVLHLRRDKKRAKEGKFKNLQIAEAMEQDTTGIDDELEFVRDLQRCFGNAALFFHGGHGTSVIGGLWRPHVRGGEARSWKIRLGYSTVPVPSEDGKKGDGAAVCKANVESMLAEMGMMGEGIVDRISVQGRDDKGAV